MSILPRLEKCENADCTKCECNTCGINAVRDEDYKGCMHCVVMNGFVPKCPVVDDLVSIMKEEGENSGD